MKRIRASLSHAVHSTRAFRVALVIAGLIALAAAALAQAEVTRMGNLQVSVNGKLSPHTLPRTGTAPVSVSVGGKVTTTDETQPPQLEKLTIKINNHGTIDSVGLPSCPRGKILNASNGRALGACGSALVGEGKFFGTLTLPGAAPYPIEGKLLVFNSSEHGHPVLLGHIYSPHPFATSFVISFQIKKSKGTYGTVLVADLTQALGNKRNLTGIEMTLDRRYSYKGKSHSYISAGCPAPKGFSKVNYPLAQTSFAFADGRTLTATMNRTCGAKG
jgi:hypothetical protein